MISKIMDLIERAVNPPKLLIEEEKAMAYFGVPMSALNTNSATVTTTIYPTQGGIGTAMGTLGSGSAGTTTYLQAMAQNPNSYNNSYNSAYGNNIVGQMTGMTVNIPFTDMNGQTWALAVDQSYAQVLQDISRAQASYNNYYHGMGQASQAYTPQAHMKMLEGDFSEEEMTEAEGIIAELEGTHGEARPPSRP